jgi:hypothetical protein
MSDTPKSRSHQQQEAARYRSSVSEALLQGIQGNINYLLESLLPVGSVIHSYLNEGQFQGETSTGWVLDDGRDISASDLSLLTGYTSLADLRGVYLRSKPNGRGNNPDGELAVGTYQADQVISHTHQEHYRTPSASSGGSDGGGDHTRGLNDIYENVSAYGGNETRPKSVTLNCFVRIN